MSAGSDSPTSRRIGVIAAGVSRGRTAGAAAASAPAAAGVCVPLDTPENALESVGGKGRSLSNMARAGFNVPGALSIPGCSMLCALLRLRVAACSRLNKQNVGSGVQRC